MSHSAQEVLVHDERSRHYGRYAGRHRYAAPLRETQRFRQWFFYLPIAAVTVMCGGSSSSRSFSGIRRVQPRPRLAGLGAHHGLRFGFPAFAAIVRVVTEVRPGQLNVRLYPFRPRTIRSPPSGRRRSATTLPLASLAVGGCASISEVGGHTTPTATWASSWFSAIEPVFS